MRGSCALVLAAMILAGCHSGSSAPGASDAGATPAADIDLVASGTTGYTASTLTFDASRTQPADAPEITFAWSLKTAPAGSAVTDLAIQGATAPIASILADVAGDYVLTVRAFDASGASVVRDVTAHAIDPLVFYVQAGLLDASTTPYLELHVGTARGHGGPSIMCPIVGDAGEAQVYYGMGFEGAGGEVDTWEGPAGTPSRVAFVTAELGADGGGSYQMFAATSDSSCAAPPIAIGAAVDGTMGQLAQPRFSPDGSRVARIEPTASGYVVSVVGFDGSAYHVLGAFSATTDDAGGFFEDPMILARPAWRDATQVGWLRPTSPSAWEVVVAADQAGASPTSYLKCDGARPRQFAFLADGRVLTTDADANGTVDLVAIDTSCTKTRVTSVPAMDRVRDFSVSPDGAEVAFLVGPPPTDAGGPFDLPGGDLHVASIDGGGDRTFDSNGAPVGGVYGARWIAGGGSLAWTKAGVVNGSENPFLAHSVSVLDLALDGGTIRDLVSGDHHQTMVAAIGNGGCAAASSGEAAGGASGLASIAIAIAIAIVFALRRARRRHL